MSTWAPLSRRGHAGTRPPRAQQRTGGTRAPMGQLCAPCVPGRTAPPGRARGAAWWNRHTGAALRGADRGHGPAPAGTRARIRHWSMDDLARASARPGQELADYAAASTATASGAGSRNHIPIPTASNCWPASSMCPPPRCIAQLGWPHWLPAFHDPYPISPSGSRAALREVQVTRMDRRSFLVLHSSALVEVAADWARVEPRHLIRALDGQRRRPGAADAGWKQRSGELRALSAAANPRFSALIDAHLHTTIDLIDQDNYTSAVQGRRLHAVAADLRASRRVAAVRRRPARRGPTTLASRRPRRPPGRRPGPGRRRTVRPRLPGHLAFQARRRGAHPGARHAPEPPPRHPRPARRTPRPGLRRTPGPSDVERALRPPRSELERARPETTPAGGVLDVRRGSERRRRTLLARPRRPAPREHRYRLRARRPGSHADSAPDPSSSPTGPRARYRHRDAAAAAADARTAWTQQRQSGAARCLDLAYALINRLDGRPEQPMKELRAYAREHLQA